MSEKPSSKPTAGKSAGSAGTKGASKAKSSDDPDESLDFLARPQGKGELGRLEHYRVLKVLGKGGMGIVFMAEDTRLHRVVALKVMLPSIAKKAIARERFIREARATAAIEHDHIVTIYEVSKEDVPVPYLAMQFLKGMTLEDWLKAGKTLNTPQIMRIGKEIAKALAAAHTRQLIHRDIKPSNIWLDAANKGRVKILDFGLARPTNEETHLTQEGMILGSPAYMSPEQARGENVDERVDLFSLGCVLYRLCAGRLPFNGKDAMSMLLEIMSKEPAPLANLNADLPPALPELVHRLLAKKPGDRPASAKEVVQEIQDIERAWIAGAHTIATRPLKRAGSRDATIGDKEVDVEPALEESAITELELQETNIPGITPPRNRTWLLAGLAGALLGLMSICCCMGVLIATDHGSVEISADEAARNKLAGAEVVLRDRENREWVLDLTSPVQLRSGEYAIDSSDLPKGLQFEPSSFILHRNESRTIKVSYVPPKSSRPALVMMTREDARKQQQDWATLLKRKISEPNTIEAKLVLIPPGEFMMGSSREWMDRHQKERKFFPGDAAYLKQIQSELPQHRVRIKEPFYLGATEVTLGQFMSFVKEKGYKTEPEKSGKGGTGLEDGREVPRNQDFTWVTPGPGYKPAKEHPVSNITWKDAEAFCEWLSKKEGKTYRLPTEAEWEYACRAGSPATWSFGDDFKVAREYMVMHLPFLPKAGKNPPTPALVARQKWNEFGLFDMHGNIAEMCADYWDPAYYQRSAKEAITIDPKGPSVTPNSSRVIRGGSFLDSPHQARSAYRSVVDPALGHVTVGFRVVCEAPVPGE